MNIKQSDFILILDLTDIHGQKMRVSDCAEFTVRVWTNDPTHYLTFKRRDIISDDYNDRIAIDKMQMECLHSGTVIFDYDYSKWNADFSATDEKYNKVKTVVTDVYWRNVMNPDNPCNVVNYQTIEHIYDLIEAERLDREQKFHELKDYVGKDFTDKLDKEIKRSNEVDIEFHKLIKANKSECDNRTAELNEKIDKEVKRSNEVDIEIFNLIKGNADKDKETTDAITEKLDTEIARATAKDTELETNLTAEIERAKTAEGAIRDAVENERDRAIAKETLISDSLTSEISRAKAVEGDIASSLQALKNSVTEEKQRSADKDTEHTNAINTEVSRATAKENEIAANLQTEIARATDREEHINADLHNEIDRAKAEEARIESLINSNADAVDDLQTALQSEITRSVNKDNELATSIADNATSIANEIARAKEAEKTIADNLANEVQRATDKDTEHTNAIATEVSRATAKENEIATNLQTEVQRATDREEHINADLHNEIDRATTEEAKLSSRIDAVIDDKSELDEKVNTEIARATEAEKTISDALNDEVKRAKAKENAIVENIDNVNAKIDDEVIRATAEDKKLTEDIAAEVTRAKKSEQEIKDLIAANANSDAELKNDLTAEIARAKAEEKRIENITTVNANNITSEISRAKQVEADITSSLQALKTTVQTKDAELTNSVNNLNSALEAEVSRATTKDAEIDSKLDIINGDLTVIGSIAHSILDSKHYTDDEIAKLKTSVNTDVENSLKGYAKKSEVDTRIETLIGAAPEALDTLGEIADKLAEDSDAITAINSVLAGKANASDVYSKNEIDTQVTTINNAIATEVSRATNAENTIAADLQTEVSRAKAAEKANSDAIAIINGNEDVIGSIAHGVADAKHYTNDEIAKIQANQNVALSNMATKNEVAEIDGKLTAHIAQADSKYSTKTEIDDKLASKADTAVLNNYATKAALQGVADMATANANDIDSINDTLPLKADKSDVYTKTEVDNLIDNVDVTEQLKDYAKIADIPTKTSELTNDSDFVTNAVVNTKLDVKADKENYYTKTEIDEMFAEINKALNYIDCGEY